MLLWLRLRLRRRLRRLGDAVEKGRVEALAEALGGRENLRCARVLVRVLDDGTPLLRHDDLV